MFCLLLTDGVGPGPKGVWSPLKKCGFRSTTFLHIIKLPRFQAPQVHSDYSHIAQKGKLRLQVERD